MGPTRSYSPSPPSPVPYAPPTASRSPTWDEYLAGSTTNGSFELTGSGFPNPMNFGDPNTAELRGGRPGGSTVPTTAYPSTSGYPSLSTSGGPSPSYSAFPAPPQRRLSPAPTNPRRKVSPLPSPVSFPVMSTSMPPLSDNMKTVVMKTAPALDLPSGTQVGRWTKREHELFLEGLQRFGKSWKKISSLVHTRTLVQIRTHAQKYLQKQSRAAIKAGAKAAEAAASRVTQTRPETPQQQQRSRGPQQQPRVAAGGQLTVQMNAPRVTNLPPRQWKSPCSGEHNSGFVPVAFPSSLSASASMPRTTSSARMTASPRSVFQLNSVNRLDQLLQEENSAIPAFVDEYYTSPTAIEDDLLRPLYTGEQWVPRLVHPGASANYSSKRRRVETSMQACSSAPTSISVAVPVLRPAFSSATFEPLPAPDNLTSPSSRPPASAQRQLATAAVLLAAHETDETTNYTNAWL